MYGKLGKKEKYGDILMSEIFNFNMKIFIKLNLKKWIKGENYI